MTFPPLLTECGPGECSLWTSSDKLPTWEQRKTKLPLTEALFWVNDITPTTAPKKWRNEQTAKCVNCGIYWNMGSRETVYFFLDTPTVRPRRPVVLVCWPRTRRLKERGTVSQYKCIQEVNLRNPILMRFSSRLVEHRKWSEHIDSRSGICVPLYHNIGMPTIISTYSRNLCTLSLTTIDYKISWLIMHSRYNSSAVQRSI